MQLPKKDQTQFKSRPEAIRQQRKLLVLLIAPPIGPIGHGKAGGVELTLVNITRGLIQLGHTVSVIAPKGSLLPDDLTNISLIECDGALEKNCLNTNRAHAIQGCENSVLKQYGRWVTDYHIKFDILLNLAYESYLLSLFNRSNINCCHLISMGNETDSMEQSIEILSKIKPNSLAFHSLTQADAFNLSAPLIILGNGFDMSAYLFRQQPAQYLGWAGRISPEKGLEDAIYVASKLNLPLWIWGVIDNEEYFNALKCKAPKNLIHWRGFKPTQQFQQELGYSQVFINTPKYNEAFGNTVIEALACGVPVITYDSGNPGKMIKNHFNGIVVPPNDKEALCDAVVKAKNIPRINCHRWANKHYSNIAFVKKVEDWLWKNVS